MKIKLFEQFNNGESILVIVDVQKSFKKFFNDKYLSEINKYCKEFPKVYQIWDNHIDGKNIDKDYLYNESPEIPIHNDLYHFPNQVDLIEKRYNYDVNVDFYKKILSTETYQKIKLLENNNQLQKGNFFETKEGTIIVYIGNNHQWYHCPKKLLNILKTNKNKLIYIVGGSDSECLEDIFVTCESMDIKILRNYKFIYSASHCPIK